MQLVARVAQDGGPGGCPKLPDTGFARQRCLGETADIAGRQPFAYPARPVRHVARIGGQAAASPAHRSGNASPLALGRPTRTARSSHRFPDSHEVSDANRHAWHAALCSVVDGNSGMCSAHSGSDEQCAASSRA